MTSVLACAVAAGTASAAVTLFDFETPAEVAAGPSGADSNRVFSIESRFATHGTNALHWTCAHWTEGREKWPSFTLPTSVTDWSRFDRLCVDLTSFGDAADTITVFCAGPKGVPQDGMMTQSFLPRRGFTQWVVPLDNWPKTTCPTNITRVHFTADCPLAFDIWLDRVTLLEKGEPLPPPEGAAVARDLLPFLAETAKARAQEKEAAAKRNEHESAYWRFRAACGQAGQDTTRFSVGLASSMTKVRPRAAFAAEPATKAEIRLARYEKESLQVLVAPGDADLVAAGVSCPDDLRRADGKVFASGNVRCAVVGYVETKRDPPYRIGYQVPSTNAVGYSRLLKRVELGWWPDPILGYLPATDVKGHDVQSFWVRVTCPEDQPAGVYTGSLKVSARIAGRDGAPTVVTVPFSVRVNDFSVPRRSPLPMAVSLTAIPHIADDTAASKADCESLRNDPETPINVWKRHRAEWGTFLADYYITMDSIYNTKKLGDMPDFDLFQRLRAEGRLDVFNLGYWSRIGKGGEAAWRTNHLPRLKANWEKAKALGMGDRCFTYGCDEAPKEEFPKIAETIRILKEELPGVPISTTAYDEDCGVGTPLKGIDWFTPLSSVYDPVKAAAARKEGRQVWWYICMGPKPPHANMFLECNAIDGRLLMGAQTTRMRPDGFLYYAICIWNSRRPITSTYAFTDWNPRSYRRFHGDGQWTCCGPDGTPLATLRLENFRDGLEDFAYALELERRLKACQNPDSAWAKSARAALAVPAEVMDTMSNYTDDPAVLRRWRDNMADLIERAVKHDM